MKTLDDFLMEPTSFNASRLISIPALYQVLKAEKLGDGTYPSPILEVARWLCNRAQEVLTVLTDRGIKLNAGSEGINVKDRWQEVSTEATVFQSSLRSKRRGLVTAYLKSVAGQLIPS